jgi:hypothetical protein
MKVAVRAVVFLGACFDDADDLIAVGRGEDRDARPFRGVQFAERLKAAEVPFSARHREGIQVRLANLRELSRRLWVVSEGPAPRQPKKRPAAHGKQSTRNSVVHDYSSLSERNTVGLEPSPPTQLCDRTGGITF